MKSHIRILLPEEAIKLATVKTGAVKSFMEESLRTGMQNRIGVRTVESGKTAMCIHARIMSAVEHVKVTVTTKTADYWFLDGTVGLDGLRRLNSVYREEDIK